MRGERRGFPKLVKKRFGRVCDCDALMGALWNGRRGRRYFAFPISDTLPRLGNGPCSFPIGLACLPTVELFGECSYGVDNAIATLPSPASFLELACSGVFGVAALAFFSVPAIQLESHRTSSPL